MMAASSRAAVQTRELSKRYRKVTALSGATVTVPEGRVSALIGPNGAGKTTLLRLRQWPPVRILARTDMVWNRARF